MKTVILKFYYLYKNIKTLLNYGGNIDGIQLKNEAKILGRGTSLSYAKN